MRTALTPHNWLKRAEMYSIHNRARAPSQRAFSLCHHHLDEFLVIDLAITINVGLPNHLIDFLIGKLLAQVRHHMTELRRADEPVPITIEDLEGFDELLFCVCVFHLASHQR